MQLFSNRSEEHDLAKKEESLSEYCRDASGEGNQKNRKWRVMQTVLQTRSNEPAEPEHEVSRMKKIRVYATLVLMICFILLAFRYQNKEGTYLVSLKTPEEGYGWVCSSMSPEGILSLSSARAEGNRFLFEFQGEKEGTAEIYFFCVPAEEQEAYFSAGDEDGTNTPADIAQMEESCVDRRTYELIVDPDLRIRQGKITRTQE